MRKMLYNGCGGSDMDSMIYNPLEEYEQRFKAAHIEAAGEFFDSISRRCSVDIEENRRTVKLYEKYDNALKTIRKKYNMWRVFRVLMIITLVLIPLVILKITPKIQALRDELGESQSKASELKARAYEQMTMMNASFSDTDALRLIESTIPALSFEPYFSSLMESEMIASFDYSASYDPDVSSVDILSGHYNDNPFLFESTRRHEMGVETYHGYKTISWTETYRDSEGRTRTRIRTETLHATVTKPKPYYKTQLALVYCSQGAPELCFSRDATHLEKKSEREIERFVRKKEKKLKRKTDKAIRENDDFVSMSNTEFEAVFDALDRTDEVQFRTLFTPLAQVNMVSLLLSKVGFGDDFAFIKRGRTNKIISEHSQRRTLTLPPSSFCHYSYDAMREGFINRNAEFFKAVYFDFAPIWSIPMYQESPISSLRPCAQPTYNYSVRQCEALVNKLAPSVVVHPQTKSSAILKVSVVASVGEVDEISVTAYSYDIVQRVDFVAVYGGDGRWHQVAVAWDDYIPLVSENKFFVTTPQMAKNRTVLAQQNNLCIYK